MKRIIAFLIAGLLSVSLVSCGKDPDNSEDTGDAADTTEKIYQSYEDLEHKSEDRFDDESILSFTHKNGKLNQERGTITCISKGGSGFVAPLDATDMKIYQQMKAASGATVDIGVESLCELYSLDTGYAAYAGAEGTIEMYDQAQGVGVRENGGALYFGYAKDGTDKWAFMDYEMLKSVILNQLVVQGAESDYTVVIVSVSLDPQKQVTQLTQLYGQLNDVMSLISVIGNK